MFSATHKLFQKIRPSKSPKKNAIHPTCDPPPMTIDGKDESTDGKTGGTQFHFVREENVVKSVDSIFLVEESIGRGVSSEVCRVTYRDDPKFKQYALKKIHVCSHLSIPPVALCRPVHSSVLSPYLIMPTHTTVSIHSTAHPGLGEHCLRE